MSKNNCYYCQQIIEPKVPNGSVLNGFKDGDMGMAVCFGCRDLHYVEKAQTEHRGKYTEMPLIANIADEDFDFESKEFDGSYADDDLND